MVKSNVRAMPKPRKSRVPVELIERLEDLKRRAREDSHKNAELDERARKLQRRLREKYLAR